MKRFFLIIALGLTSLIAFSQNCDVALQAIVSPSSNSVSYPQVDSFLFKISKRHGIHIHHAADGHIG